MTPDPIREDTFGRLEWDALLECWLGGIHWPGELHTEVAIAVSTGRWQTAFTQARESLAWLQQQEQQVQKIVAEAAASIYNDAWRIEEEPVTTSEFARRLEIVRVRFEEDGSLLLSYDACEMFGGHILDADIKPDRSLSGVTLGG